MRMIGAVRCAGGSMGCAVGTGMGSGWGCVGDGRAGTTGLRYDRPEEVQRGRQSSNPSVALAYQPFPVPKYLRGRSRAGAILSPAAPGQRTGIRFAISPLALYWHYWTRTAALKPSGKAKDSEMTTVDVHVATAAFNKPVSYTRTHQSIIPSHHQQTPRQQPLMQSYKYVPRPGHVRHIIANWPPRPTRRTTGTITTPAAPSQQTKGPIYKLPREILEAIFDHYMTAWEWKIHADIHTVSPMFNELARTLRNISMVCRLWRFICHDSPRLWRNILHCSLEVELQHTHHFRMCMDRCRKVHMDMWVSGYSELLEVYDYLREKDAFERVRSLHVGHAQIATRLDKDVVPWFMSCELPNVKRFSLDYADLSMCEFAEYLKQFPKLEYLRLLHDRFSDYAELAADTEAQDARVAIPNVACIELIQEKRDWISQVMQRLVTTNLTGMSITLSSRKGPGNTASITLADAPWMCISLRKIALGNHLDYADIIGIIQPLLALSHLHLFRSAVWGAQEEETKQPCDALLAMLHSRPRGGDTLVPALRILSFYAYPLSTGALYDLVLNRKQAHSVPLKMVGLDPEWMKATPLPDLSRITNEVDVFGTTAYHLHEWQYFAERRRSGATGARENGSCSAISVPSFVRALCAPRSRRCYCFPRMLAFIRSDKNKSWALLEKEERTHAAAGEIGGREILEDGDGRGPRSGAGRGNWTEGKEQEGADVMAGWRKADRMGWDGWKAELDSERKRALATLDVSPATPSKQNRLRPLASVGSRRRGAAAGYGVLPATPCLPRV
ncbi:hypothetical protein CALVIDRAFT_555566 [Calocera viscosa TUFC12733]|uniref:F-box domain-containing protein n=1 Tax=Calocera viscosa (strain TUFC12733) TaxID=1330018 RepID=A0A167LM55_CALVF|nr:hypothetical protein CALVIDRAFT_555566 [Calocera viscosa TUFC12733]